MWNTIDIPIDNYTQSLHLMLSHNNNTSSGTDAFDRASSSQSVNSRPHCSTRQQHTCTRNVEIIQRRCDHRPAQGHKPPAAVLTSSPFLRRTRVASAQRDGTERVWPCHILPLRVKATRGHSRSSLVSHTNARTPTLTLKCPPSGRRTVQPPPQCCRLNGIYSTHAPQSACTMHKWVADALDRARPSVGFVVWASDLEISPQMHRFPINGRVLRAARPPLQDLCWENFWANRI